MPITNSSANELTSSYNDGMEPNLAESRWTLESRRPSCLREFTDLIEEARGSDLAVYPHGGQSWQDYGGTPSKPGLHVDTRGLSKIIDYPARDLTITVEAGISLHDLQAALDAEGQRLPVDVPHPTIATLGGSLAVNCSGPRRYQRGTFRDYVIGIGFMSDQGVEISGGGRVVKNVAGYDLMKLQIGALGTLGVITRVTLKVTPKPEDQAIMAFGLSSAAVGPTLDRLVASHSRPDILELVQGSLAPMLAKQSQTEWPTADPWVVLVGFEAKASTVDWQLRTLQEELRSAPARDVMVHRGSNVSRLLQAVTDLQRHSESVLTWKAVVRPSHVAKFVSDAAMIRPEASIHAHAGTGVVFGHHVDPELTLEQAQSIVSRLSAAVADSQGHLTVCRCHAGWKKHLPLWTPAIVHHPVMRAIKKTLDPNGLFNPGRYFPDL